MPQDTAEAAVVQHFMTDVAAQMMAGLVAARRITLFDARLDAETALRKSHEVLTGLEHTLRLGESNYMMGDQPNVADIAFYSYVYLAPEGRVSLAPYPRLRNWLFLMELLPNFIRMTDSPVGLKRRESIGC